MMPGTVAGEVRMNAKVGDRIVVESESVGTPTREGKVLEVTSGEVGVRYRVRWNDGHETVFTPSGGSARIVPKRRSKTG
jgi:UDP-N-acetylenolpyruvoylglucosamine reductase